MYQKLMFIGNLGQAPEMKFTPSGKAVTNLSVATNRRYTSSNGERVEETCWFRVSVWGSQAEACNQYLQTGSRVLVEGRLKPDDSGNPRVFTRNDGSAGASFEVVASRVVFLDSRGDVEKDVGDSEDFSF